MNLESIDLGALGVSRAGRFALKHPKLAIKAKRAFEPKSVALIPERLALGSTMIFHGYSKLKAEAREPTAQAFEGMGFKPGKFWGFMTGASEILAGATSIIGIGTRIGALAVLVTQGFAIAKVHAQNGFDTTKGGFEWNLALIAMAASLLIAGPGKVSAHEALEHALQRRARRKLFFSGPKKSITWVKLLK